MKIEKQNEKVFFESDGKKLAALLFKPENFDKNKKYPAVIVTRPASLSLIHISEPTRPY